MPKLLVEQEQPVADTVHGELHAGGAGGHAPADAHDHLGAVVPAHWQELAAPFSTQGQVFDISVYEQGAPQVGGDAGHPLPPQAPEQAHLPFEQVQSLEQTSLQTCAGAEHWKPWVTKPGQPDAHESEQSQPPEVQLHTASQLGPLG